jgi:hypothetical protein
LRTEALAKPEVGDFLKKHYVAVYDRVGTFQVNVGSDGKTANKNGGNVAAFLCTTDGRVIHAIAGPRTAEAFLAEVKWATAVTAQILGQSRPHLYQTRAEYASELVAALRQAHSGALKLLKQPDPFAPLLELVHHNPSADPKLQGLEAAGRGQRERVHQLLQHKALEPLASVGPAVSRDILGEKLSDQPVQLTGAPEPSQAAAPAERLIDFLSRSSSARPSSSAKPSAAAPRSQRSKGELPADKSRRRDRESR